MKKLVSYILIIFIIIVVLNIFYSKIILKENLVKVFGKSFLIVTSGSMEPEINCGELIIIDAKEEYKKNDVVTYSDKDGYFVTHRIIDINDNEVVLKGDSNNINDDKILNESIKGKVIYHSKILGFFILYILKPLVVIYIILFIVINIFFYIASKRIKEDISQEKEEKENVETNKKNDNNL